MDNIIIKISIDLRLNCARSSITITPINRAVTGIKKK